MRKRRFAVGALAAAMVAAFGARASAAPPPQDFTRGTAVIAVHVQDHLPPGLGGQLPPGQGGLIPGLTP